MKKRILASIVIAGLLCSGCLAGDETNQRTEEELMILIEENQSIKVHAANMAASARELGWTDDDELIKELQEKWHTADENVVIYQQELNDINAKWQAKEKEYPVATYIWKYMKAQGWNDYVCAGIMGNIMAETGGQTLNIDYTASSSNYYGMCQWNKAYSDVQGANLEGQCSYLVKTIKYEFDTFGSKYKRSFDYEAFLKLKDCRAAAEAFAKAYERCSSASHAKRRDNAITAYKYFTE